MASVDPQRSGNAGVSNSGPSRVKTRRLRACDHCRLRKIRCDNSPGTCRNCETYGEICVVSRNGVTYHRQQAQPSTLQQPGRRKQRRQFEQPDQSSVTRKQFTEDISLGQTGETTVRSSGAGENTPGEEPSVTGSEAVPPTQGTNLSCYRIDTLHAVVTTDVGRFPQNAKFAGLSSSQVLARIAQQAFSTFSQMNVMDFFCPTMTFAENFPLREPTIRPLVCQQVADKCIYRYFNTYYTLYPILDRSKVEDDYRAFYDGRPVDAPHICCILLAIALGSNSSSIFDSHLKAAFSLCHSLVARPFLESVQALLLMAICFLNAGRDGQAILYVGLASQIAQSIGLHRSVHIYRHPCEISFVTKNHDIRNCLWWTCYCLDKKLSFEAGRLSVICDDDCDAEPPDRPGLSLTMNADGQPYFDFLKFFIALTKILSKISRSLFHKDTPNLDNNELIRRIAAADKELLDWRDSLPEELQPDREPFAPEDELSGTGSRMLHCVYHNALVIIHRSSLVSEVGRTPYAKRSSNRRIAASGTICLSAARSLIRSVNHLAVEDRNFRVSGWTNPYAINAVMILYIGIMNSPLQWSVPSDLALMRSMQACFDCSPDAGLSTRFRALIDSFIDAIHKAEAYSRSSSLNVTIGCGEEGSNRPSPCSNTLSASVNPATNAPSHDIAGNVPRTLPINELGQRTTNVETDCSGGRWVMTPQSSESIPSPTFIDSQITSVGPGNESFQLGDLFGDQPTAWNMALWPLWENEQP